MYPDWIKSHKRKSRRRPKQKLRGRKNLGAKADSNAPFFPPELIHASLSWSSPPYPQSCPLAIQSCPLAIQPFGRAPLPTLICADLRRVSSGSERTSRQSVLALAALVSRKLASLCGWWDKSCFLVSKICILFIDLLVPLSLNVSVRIFVSDWRCFFCLFVSFFFSCF